MLCTKNTPPAQKHPPQKLKGFSLCFGQRKIKMILFMFWSTKIEGFSISFGLKNPYSLTTNSKTYRKSLYFFRPKHIENPSIFVYQKLNKIPLNSFGTKTYRKSLYFCRPKHKQNPFNFFKTKIQRKSL